VEVKIIHTSNHTDEDAYDTSDLKRINPNIVEVQSIDVAGLLNSVGVLHSKLLIADRKHFYLGSANLSDRGLTRTKEMGVFLTSCIRLAEDAAKLFEVYWEMAKTTKVPRKWAPQFSSEINMVSPQVIIKMATFNLMLRPCYGALVCLLVAAIFPCPVKPKMWLKICKSAYLE
jgi:phosphatidylserine/phosphatidylglycerophosphate/cardiolipin synthase-like enzyme